MLRRPEKYRPNFPRSIENSSISLLDLSRLVSPFALELSMFSTSRHMNDMKMAQNMSSWRNEIPAGERKRETR